MRALLARRADPNARAYAAGVVQFELLLSTSKPLIPLCCLLATGQVFNGIFFSIATAQVLHRLPGLRAETQHLLVLLVGALHTLVCAGKSQLMELEKAPEGLLQLQWTWGMRDVFAIANMLLIGASFSTAAATFNEPPFCASFAAGLALRIAIYEATPSALPTTRHTPPSTRHPPPSTRHPPHATLRHATLHCAVLYRATPPRPPRHRRTPASSPQGSQPAVSPSSSHHRRRHPRAPSPLRRSAPPLWARGCASSCAARTSSTSASTRSPPLPHFRPRLHPASTPRPRPPPPPPPSPPPSFLGLQVAARAVGRIGSCGGGPVRAALGGWGAEWLLRAAAVACKATLLVLPLLAAAQWGLRAARAGQRLRREGARQARPYRSAGSPLSPPSPALPKAYARAYAWHTVVYARHVHVPCSAHRGRRRVASR